MLFVLLAKHFINPHGLRQPSDNVVLLSLTERLLGQDPLKHLGV